MAAGLNTHYHLMLAVINTFSLLVLSTDIMMASPSLSLSLSLSLRLFTALHPKLFPCEFCLRVCYITRWKMEKENICVYIHIVCSGLEEQTFLTACFKTNLQLG